MDSPYLNHCLLDLTIRKLLLIVLKFSKAVRSDCMLVTNQNLDRDTCLKNFNI